MHGHSLISNRMINDNLKKIYEECKNCEFCELHKTRNNIVFADGNPETSKIFLIGEAPGENEDLQGKPFVGAAGKRLNNYLEQAGLSREKDLYIANIVKCRPPKNRVPSKTEKTACKKYLEQQILQINPKLILLCGSTAMDSYLKDKKITQAHGQIFEIEILNKTFNAMPILHPSPLCRFENKTEVMVKDLILAKNQINNN